LALLSNARLTQDQQDLDPFLVPATAASYESLMKFLPRALAGVAAVLANEIEDAGEEWPDTDAVGPESRP